MSDVLREAFHFPSVAASAVAAGSLETTCQLKIESVERFSGDINRVRDELDEAGAGQEVFVVCQTEAEVRRLGEIFGTHPGRQPGPLAVSHRRTACRFPAGARPHRALSSGELFRRADLRARRGRLSRVIDSFLELREGDLVVHIGHGIARYRGLKLLEKNGQVEEHLELEFHGHTKLFVPSTKIGLVQKYVGGTKSRPTLAKLGGRLWGRQKERVEEAVTDLAADMLELQATRASRPGIAFPADTEWQREFDASFPYHETADQWTTIDAIKRDMCLPRPMDRLLCGDVGYGKTELAMRATFKAVDAGYQVAVLVPTTLLCEQHLRTFTERMAEFPFEIAALSRFATRRQQTRHPPPAGGRLVGHRHRHAPSGAARRAVPQPRAGDHRRGAAVRRGGEGAAEGPAADRRRADHDGHAHPAHAAHGRCWGCATSPTWKRRPRTAWRSRRA